MFWLLFWFPAFLFFLFTRNDSWMMVISDHRCISMLSNRNTISHRSSGSGRRVQAAAKSSSVRCSMQNVCCSHTENDFDIDWSEPSEECGAFLCVLMCWCVCLCFTHTLCTENPSATSQQMAKEKSGGWTEAQIQLVAPHGLSSSRCFVLVFLWALTSHTDVLSSRQH